MSRQIALMLSVALALPAAHALAAGQSGEVSHLVSLARDEASDTDAIAAVAERLGLPTLPRNAAPATPPITAGDAAISTIPLDLIMVQLATTTGTRYDGALRPIQASRTPDALVVRGGTTDLAGLFATLQAGKHADAISRTETGYELHQPLIIWQDAGLHLGEGETLALDRAEGSFLVSFGQLAISGATIAASGAVNERLEEFSPFVLVATSGSAQIEGARFERLGFGPASPMSGLSFAQGGLFKAATPSFVANSSFVESGPLAVFGSEGMAISGNRFIAPRDTGLVLSGTTGSRVVGNIIGSSAIHGIKITNGSSAAQVAGNVIAGGAGNGIFVDAGSRDIALDGNLLAGIAGTGIGLDSSACITLTDNAIRNSGQKGVTVAASTSVLVSGNAITDNDSSGIFIGAQDATSDVAVVDNIISGNRIGITGRAGGRLVLARNDLSGQTPRLLSGEIGQFTAALLRSPERLALSPLTPTTNDAAKAVPAAPAIACKNRENG